MTLPVTTDASSKSLVTATLVGFVAIVLWGFSPLTALLLKDIPAFQLTFLLFFIAFFVTLFALRKQWSKVKASLRMPIWLWGISIMGVLGFNYLYIVALRNAPAVDVVLIVNLWPIVMMLLSIISERRRLESQHLLGAALGLAGVFLCVTGGKEITPDSRYLLGYLMAAGCALVWPVYSLVNRRVASENSTYVVPWLCLISACIALLLHLTLETTTLPASAGQWAYLCFAGAGATGLSFLFWDYGVKRGDIRLLSNISYAEPLLGILVLIIFGYAVFTPLVAFSAALITAGAALSSLTLKKLPADTAI